MLDEERLIILLFILQIVTKFISLTSLMLVGIIPRIHIDHTNKHILDNHFHFLISSLVISLHQGRATYNDVKKTHQDTYYNSLFYTDANEKFAVLATAKAQLRRNMLIYFYTIFIVIVIFKKRS